MKLRLVRSVVLPGHVVATRHGTIVELADDVAREYLALGHGLRYERTLSRVPHGAPESFPPAGASSLEDMPAAPGVTSEASARARSKADLERLRRGR